MRRTAKLFLVVLILALATSLTPVQAAFNPCSVLDHAPCFYVWNPATLCCRTPFHGCVKLICR